SRAFVWTPPDVRYPTRAQFAFWHDDGNHAPEPPVLELPLLGRTELEMATEPGAEVLVRVGASTFGPVRANKRGLVRVPIEVPPGVREALVLATVGGQQTQRAVPLEVPVTRPVAVALATEAIPAEGGYLIIARPEHVPASEVSVTSESARLEPLPSDRELSLYRVVPQEGALEIALSVRVRDNDAQWLRAPVVMHQPPGVTREPEPTSLAPSGRFALQGQIGFFAAGGANLGPTLELGGSWRLPLWGERLSVEAGVGLRTAALSQSVDALGSMDSRVVAFPLFVALRGRVFSRGPWAVDARAGVGAVPFTHAVDAQFQPDFSEGGVGFDAFLGAQGSYRLSSVELLLDLRAEWTRLTTPYLVATPGGFVLGLGARWGLP
ncbi:MAG: hypothetical protein WBV82_33390, partial [Myxococcaceae bacterium]